MVAGLKLLRPSDNKLGARHSLRFPMLLADDLHTKHRRTQSCDALYFGYANNKTMRIPNLLTTNETDSWFPQLGSIPLYVDPNTSLRLAIQDLF